MSEHLQDFITEFARYRAIGDKAIAQVGDAALNRTIAIEGNSIAMLVRHISGNLRSRFTDFITTDGEKSDRDRDAEFREREYTRREIDAMWLEGWETVTREVGRLAESDLGTTVTIRGAPLTVHEALTRSVAHTAYHVGQIVLLARVLADTEWQWISIPKEKSAEYNRNPSLEKGFR